ncbi:MAG: tetratricopeptide repeat protein [Rhizonema sp. PD38]|nr:tetratricopeptide repeat protein [Rhizonema sp. PD38]
MDIAREIGDHYGEAQSFGSLASVYSTLKDYEKAIKYYEECLIIKRELKHHKAAGEVLRDLGEAYYKFGNYAKAVEFYQEYLVVTQEYQNHQEEWATLGEIGRVYSDQENYAKAVEYFEQCLLTARNLQNRAMEMQPLRDLGIAYRKLRANTVAIEYLQQCLLIARELQEREMVAQILRELGITYRVLGDYLKAIDYHEQRLVIWRDMQDHLEETLVLNDLAVIYYKLGNYDVSIKYSQQELVIVRELRNRQGELRSLRNLGNNYLELGNYIKAIECYQQQLIIAQEIGERKMEGQALGNLGVSYRLIGDYNKAVKYSKRLLIIAPEILDHQLEVMALNNLGIVYHLQQYQEQALEYYEQSLMLSREFAERIDEVAPLCNLGLVYYDFVKYDKALEYFEECLRITRELKVCNSEGNVLGNIGLVYSRFKNYEKAIDYQNQRLKIVREIQSPLGEGEALSNIGSDLYNVGNLLDAKQALLNAIKIWESIRLKLGSNDVFKISIFETQAVAYQLLQKVLIAQNQINDALEIAERGRTRAFAELLARRLSPELINQTIEAPTIKQIQDIAKTQNATLIEYSIYSTQYHDPERPKGKFLDLALFIWVIKPNGEVRFHLFDLTPIWTEQINSLEDLILQARQCLGVEEKQRDDAMSNNSLETVQTLRHISQPLRQLHQILIEPIAENLPTDPNTHVIFIPQGSLFLVPFPTLQDSKGKFLIEKHNIITAPSIHVLELTQKRSADVPETSLEALVVGNPKMPTIPLTEPPVQLKDLAWAKIEANAIAPLLNTQVVTDADATKAYITQLLPKARLIHLATHGLLDDIRQLGIPGAVTLAPSDDDHGFLTAGEIYDMKLNAELVVLSACSTGQGKITGDGVIGLSRCLIAAGVKSVIVSLWSVSDLSTALLMVKFYQIFQQGVSATVAFNKAQRWLLGITKTELEVWVKTNERFFDATLRINLRRRLHQLDDKVKLFQHPRYWAAFCVLGQ